MKFEVVLDHANAQMPIRRQTDQSGHHDAAFDVFGVTCEVFHTLTFTKHRKAEKGSLSASERLQRRSDKETKLCLKHIQVREDTVDFGGVILRQVELEYSTGLGLNFEKVQESLMSHDYRFSGVRKSAVVDTGIRVAIPFEYCLLIKERSGLGFKGVSIRAGVIDNTYTGPVKIKFEGNVDAVSRAIEKNKAVAQMLLVKNSWAQLVNLDAYPESRLNISHRKENGFGSTDINR